MLILWFSPLATIKLESGLKITLLNILPILSIDNNSGKHFIPSKSTHLNEENQEAFDLQTYKRFLSFLKFQEMMDKYNT